MNHSLAELLHEQLRDLYDAEQQYLRMLPRMAENSTHGMLRSFMKETEYATSENSAELARVCTLLGIEPTGVACEAMEGLIREVKRSAGDIADSATMDASLIANAQRIAHYEIAGFGTASAFAKCLGATEAASILANLAKQAGTRDQALTKIATGGWFSPGVNDEAAAAA
jgi:ferritin-like metal-binding protein YciE